MRWDKMKSSEKFIAFCLLGLALVSLAYAVYLHPLPDTNGNSASLQIINTIVGALTLAFGGAANALFRIKEESENRVIVDNTKSDPVPTEPSTPVVDDQSAVQVTPVEELPEYARQS